MGNAFLCMIYALPGTYVVVSNCSRLDRRQVGGHGSCTSSDFEKGEGMAVSIAGMRINDRCGVLGLPSPGARKAAVAA